jgi:hypothetical protein
MTRNRRFARLVAGMKKSAPKTARGTFQSAKINLIEKSPIRRQGS